MPKEKSPKASNKRLRQIISVVRKHDLIRNFKPENLKSACEELGPCFVKMGQMAAMRSDLIPQEICDELLQLCNDVQPMAPEEVTAALTEAYHKPIEEVFASFDPQPIGSASLAQVHRAVLLSGEDAAVKVQRPGIRESMLTDIGSIETLAKRFSKTKLVEMLDLNTMVRVFKETTLEELDFLHEARNIQEYREKNKDIHYCYAPEVYTDLCTEKVLVMEYIDGPLIGDFDALREEGYDFHDLAAKYVKNMMKQVTTDGLCHYDPHPANLKLHDGKLVWLDWGMAGHFSSGERELIRDFYLAMTEGDPVTLTECFILLNAGTAAPNKAILYEGVKDILSKARLSGAKDLDVGAMLKTLLDTLRRSHIVLGSDFIMLLRSFATMESVTMSLDPDTDLAELLTDGIKETIKECSNSEEELQKWAARRLRNWKKISSIPVNLADIIRNMAGNLSGIKIDINIQDDTKSFMTWLTRVLLQGLVVVTLIISSSIICAAGIEPKLWGLPILGLSGFAAAVVMGIILSVTFRKK